MQDAEIKVRLLGFYAHLGADGVAVAKLAYDWVFERGGHTQGVLQGHPSEPTSADAPPPRIITGQADGILLSSSTAKALPTRGWPEERKTELKRLREAGLKNREIGDRLGCSLEMVSFMIRKMGLPKKRMDDASRKAAALDGGFAGRAAHTERQGDQAICRSDAPPSASAHPTTASGGVRGASNKPIRPASAGAGSAKAGSTAGIFLDVSSLNSPPAGTSPAGGIFSKSASADSDEEKVQDFLRRNGATTEAHYGELHDVFVLMKSWGFGYVPASAKRFVTDPISGAQLRNDDFFAMCRKECQRRNHSLPASLAEKSRRAAK